MLRANFLQQAAVGKSKLGLDMMRVIAKRDLCTGLL
jgi:hypothetical protein